MIFVKIFHNLCDSNVECEKMSRKGTIDRRQKMERIGANFIAALLFMTLTFSPIFQFSHGALGEESEPCWSVYQSDEDTLSAYVEVFRTFALPPAWRNPDQGQQEPPTHQTVAKWETRMGPYVASN